MEINIPELKQICSLLFTFLEESGIDKIEIEKLDYWHISQKDIYNFSSFPKELLVGSLTEDLSYLQDLLNAKKEIYPTILDFQKLAPLIRYIGDSQS